MTPVDLDHALFRFLNRDLANPLFDFLMPIISNSDILIITLLSLLGLYAIRHKFRKKALITVGTALLLFAATDLLTYRVLKPLFGRKRPANAAYFNEQGEHRFFPECNFFHKNKGGYSFPSNHAVNIAGQGVFWACVTGGASAVIILISAAAVAYSRVYLGVHYPFDVLTGFLLGAVMGWSAWLIVQKKKAPPNTGPEEQASSEE
ncbi:MAG: phosphatase PAP2 family protein [Fibrobacterota bacterium]